CVCVCVSVCLCVCVSVCVCVCVCHLQVEAQQVTDDSRHSGQDDHLSYAVQQRVHGQPIQTERGVQLLVNVCVSVSVSVCVCVSLSKLRYCALSVAWM